MKCNSIYINRAPIVQSTKLHFQRALRDKFCASWSREFVLCSAANSLRYFLNIIILCMGIVTLVNSISWCLCVFLSLAHSFAVYMRVMCAHECGAFYVLAQTGVLYSQHTAELNFKFYLENCLPSRENRSFFSFFFFFFRSSCSSSVGCESAQYRVGNANKSGCFSLRASGL